MTKHVNQHIQGRIQMSLGNFDPVVGEFSRCVTIENTTSSLDFRGNGLRSGSPFGALEQHMLDEVSGPLVGARLVPGTDTQVEPHTHRASVGHRRGQDAQAVIQSGLLAFYHQSVSPQFTQFSLGLFLRQRVLRWPSLQKTLEGSDGLLGLPLKSVKRPQAIIDLGKIRL